MPRSTNAPASRRRRRRRLDQAKGYRGARKKLFRQATEAVDRAMRMATVHRRRKKREFRALWIARVSAACRQNGISYSRLTEGLNKAGVGLNRKMLSEIAFHDPEGFSSIVEKAKAGLS
ncbi:MAG: 50S ribosomal protein L20 [Lentisphaerae bacterium]|nr:50S ribosomal protein L20 [Lentisphaerota bacterium]